MDWSLVDSLVGAQGEIMLIKLDTKIGLNSSELKQLGRVWLLRKNFAHVFRKENFVCMEY